jgi:hypothetical protein
MLVYARFTPESGHQTRRFRFSSRLQASRCSHVFGLLVRFT